MRNARPPKDIADNRWNAAILKKDLAAVAEGKQEEAVPNWRSETNEPFYDTL